MYYPVLEPLLLIGKSSLCGSSAFPLLLSEWSFTICLTSYNCTLYVLSGSLNKKTFPSFFHISMGNNLMKKHSNNDTQCLTHFAQWVKSLYLSQGVHILIA